MARVLQSTAEVVQDPVTTRHNYQSLPEVVQTATAGTTTHRPGILTLGVG